MFDISRPLNRYLPTYPTDPRPRFRRLKRLDRGDSYALSQISLGSHTGTHLDAPAHVWPGGATADAVALESLLTWVEVRDLRHPVEERSPRLGPPIGGGLLLRLPTTGLDASLVAPWLSAGLRLLGTDLLTIEPEGLMIHRELLAHNVALVEGLDLEGIPEGLYFFVGLPLRLALDGSPLRAVLLTPGEAAGLARPPGAAGSATRPSPAP